MRLCLRPAAPTGVPVENHTVIDLSVVIVSWNVSELLELCLSSLMECGGQGGLQCEIIVVDNASSDDSPELVRQRFPTAQLIASESNLGFAMANNVGAAQSSGRYILFLNPDTEVIGDALSAMVAYMDRHPDVGVLGPTLLWPNGCVQSSRRRFPTLATAFIESTFFQQWWPSNPVLRRYYVQDQSDDREQDVDWLVGACLLVRRQAWKQVGPMDERFFMYSEELDWCRRLKTAGWRVVYTPSAEVVHHGAQSSSQVAAEREIHFQSSKALYFYKHHGARAGEVVRLFLLATYVYKSCLEAAKWLLGHKRPLRRERLAAYRGLLRSGLRAQADVESSGAQARRVRE